MRITAGVYQTDAHGRLLCAGDNALTGIRRGLVELIADPDHPFEVVPV